MNKHIQRTTGNCCAISEEYQNIILILILTFETDILATVQLIIIITILL